MRRAGLVLAAVSVLLGLVPPVLGAVPAEAASPSTTVPASMQAGDEVWSPARAYRLTVQPDGNLVVYRADGAAVWDAVTWGRPGARLAVQPDGNVVVYAASGQPVWSTWTHTGRANRLTIGDDGLLAVVAPSGQELWRSRRLELAPGASLSSPRGAATLDMQPDGNLVVHRSDGTVLWHTGTYGNPGARLVVQDDGNAVVYSTAGRALWDAGTSSGRRDVLGLRDDGLLVLVTALEREVWRSSPVALAAGQTLRSAYGAFSLTMQPDGNLVVHDSGGRAVWDAGTWGTGAARAALQPDGNLVVSLPDGTPVWHTATNGTRSASLVVQDDGNLVVYRLDGSAAWAASGSRGTPYVPPFAWSSSAVTEEQLGWTWHQGCPVGPADLRQLTVRTVGPDGRVRPGRIVVHTSAVDVVRRALGALYDARFPLRSVVPVAELPPGEDPSMDRGNSYGFQCRYATGSTTTWSVHAYGLAVDLNPVENPYVKGGTVIPSAGAAYVDRSVRRPGMLYAGDPAHAAFRAAGWGWGGSWTSLKDYMHFSSNGR